MRFSAAFDNDLVIKSSFLRKIVSQISILLARVENIGFKESDYSQQPPIFINSLPKSGTHLMLQVARSIPNVRYYGRFIAQQPSVSLKCRSQRKIDSLIRKVLPFEAVGAHLHYSDTSSIMIQKMNAVHVFVYRDPRDVLLSEIYYLTNSAVWHRMHGRYKRELSFGDRLTLALKGCDDLYPSANHRYLPYVNWRSERSVLPVRFEDMVGSGMENALERILLKIQEMNGSLPPLSSLSDQLIRSIRPEKSHTFRKGAVGGWKTELDKWQQKEVTHFLEESLLAFGYDR